MLRFALFSPPDEGPPLFKDHLCVNHRVVSQEGDYCTIYLFFLLISAKEKNGHKQVKKKAFKINAKIEDVGLNED